MTRRRFVEAIGAAAALKALGAPAAGMGIAWTSYMTVAKPQDPIDFLTLAHDLGAAGIQTPLRGDLRQLRSQAEKFGMYVEGMVPLPSNADTSVFEKSLQDAKDAGAVCVRAGALSGRRYESFASLADWRKFAADSQRNIAAAIPILEKHKMPLALENHKDWTADELAALMQSHSSEYLGVCLDFGNNISLLDDPMNVVELLAPFTIATHVKDMSVEWYNDGFLLSEVVLGQGFLDLPGMLAAVHKARPSTHFSLEMITRDPLQIPCLTEKYWTTFPERNGVFLARTMQLVQKHKSAKPLPRISGLPHDAQLQAEQQNVRASLRYAREKLTIPSRDRQGVG